MSQIKVVKDKKVKKERNDKDSKDKKNKKEKKEKKDRGDKKRKKDVKNDTHSEPAKSLAPTVKLAAASAPEIEEDIKVELPEAISRMEPYLEMSEVAVDKRIAEFLQRYPKPTPIQAQTWPYLLKKHDLVGVAETGSGKTMAFGVPAIQRIISEKPRGLFMLVISPTRELAMQIYDNMALLTTSLNIKTACVYGGVSKRGQQYELEGAQIVVGTPGRLRDFLQDGALSLSTVQYFVLDEADRMLEKGFEQDIKAIATEVSSKSSQTVMFTATWPSEVRELAASFMRPDVVRVTVGEADELAANKRITQIVEVISPEGKERRFLELLREYTRKDPTQKILIFALYKKETARVEYLLQRQGYKVAAIHGNLNQHQRTQALDDFKTGSKNMLLATDVAARGLDIPAVKVVLNLTFPLTVEDYVHRIGRTGRAGQTGIAHTLFTENEKHLAGALGNVLRKANQTVPDDLLKFGSHTKKKEHSLYGAFFNKDFDPTLKAKKTTFD